jgi:hypothetical protein
MAKNAKEAARQPDHETRYGDELLSANWNPVIGLLRWSCMRTLEVARAEEQRLTEEEAAGFLGRIYSAG